MKYLIPTTVLLFILLTFNLSAQKISSDSYNKNLIHEDFNQETEHFKIITTTDNYFILDNGDYLLSRNNETSEYALIANNSLATNFVLKTVVRIGPSNNKKASLGIILKAQQDGKGAIIFEINKRGEYRVKQLLGNTYKTLSGVNKHKGWVKNKAVNGVDEYNFIEIRTENNIYDVYINSEYLTTFFIPDYTSGSCGLIISPSTKARISYYYLNIKGEKEPIASYVNVDTQSINATIEELHKKIITLEENNVKLNALNAQAKGNEEEKEEISYLKNKNTNLEAVTTEQERKIARLNRTLDDLKNNAAKAKELETINQSNTASISDLESKNTTLAKKIEELKSQLTNTETENTNLESKNTALTKEIKETKNQLTNTETKNTNLTEITTEQEKKIKSLTTSAKNLKNSSDEITTSNQQLNKKIKALKQEVSLKKSINTELVTDLEKANKSSNIQITQLNTKVKTLKSEVNKLETSNSTLSTDLSKEKSAHKQAKSGLSTAIKKKTAEVKELSSELNNTNHELNTLKVTQARHNDITSDLNAQINDLNNRLEVLNNQLNTSNNDVTTLEATNSELKELFIQKDFEVNGVKPSEMIKQTSNKPAPKIIKNKKTFYTVQFGVFMQEQINSSIKNLDDVWYNTTENGTYVYYSGEFSSPQEVTAHKNKIVELYPNAFIVTLTK